MLTIELPRRAFLKTTGALVVTFTIAPSLGAAPASGKSVALDQVDGFIAIDAQGNVKVFSGKVDLGTGVQTAMAQIAAEELSVPLAKVEVIQGDTALTPDQGITWGSLSIETGGMQVRRACATAREALLDQAAKKLGASRADLAVKDGTIRSATGKGVTYGELIGGRQFEMKLDPKAPMKDPSQYTIVGKPVPRLDIPGKVTGTFTYMQDFKVDGMLEARVVRPKALKATLVSLDDTAAKAIPGYIATIRKGSFVAGVGKNEWAAIRAANAMKPIWSDWAGLPEKAKLWDHVRSTKVVKEETLQTTGESKAAMKGAAKTLAATYDFAIHTHGSIGPSCAIADYKDGKLVVWTASQATHSLRKQLARMLSMNADDVRCIYVEGAGCYGRNGHEDAAADAALIAKEIGKPIRVQWSRADEHGWDPKGPPTLIDMRGGLDAAGKVVAWESTALIPDRPKPFDVTLVAAELAGLPKDEAFPGNIHQSLAIPYTFPNVTAAAHWLAETPFKPSWIRTPGRMQNTFANESFIDELAAAAGVDPIEFRRRSLDDPRGLALLDRLVKLADWKPRSGPPSPAAGDVRPPSLEDRRATTRAPSGDVAKGRGVSYIKYELKRTYVGAVADVTVDRKTGKVKVDRFYVAHDCGQIINPDGLKNQIEGNVVQTVSRTLIEDLQFDRSMVTSLDWATYPILTFPDVPDVVIDLIDRPKEAPWGAGEPTAAVVPSAVANAVFDATGARLRSVPITPDKVLAASKGI